MIVDLTMASVTFARLFNLKAHILCGFPVFFFLLGNCNFNEKEWTEEEAAKGGTQTNWSWMKHTMCSMFVHLNGILQKKKTLLHEVIFWYVMLSRMRWTFCIQTGVNFWICFCKLHSIEHIWACVRLNAQMNNRCNKRFVHYIFCTEIRNANLEGWGSIKEEWKDNYTVWDGLEWVELHVQMKIGSEKEPRTITIRENYSRERYIHFKSSQAVFQSSISGSAPWQIFIYDQNLLYFWWIQRLIFSYSPNVVPFIKSNASIISKKEKVQSDWINIDLFFFTRAWI